MATINLPFAASAVRRAPDADELANGYGCGDADLELFDWLAWWLSGQIAGAVDAGGQAVDDTDLLRLAKAIQSGKSNYAVASGTANAWVVAPNLAVPAYAAGRALNIIAPATNTSTIVNMNVSSRGDRRVKKSDGCDPAPGDLVSGKVYATIDDGTNIRILTPLPSEYVGRLLQPTIQSYASSTTWTKPAGLIGVWVRVEAAGGGGGLSSNVSASPFFGGGGGNGGYGEKFILAADLGATETVTVGIGGTGRTTGAGAGPGTAGGASSFGSHISASGGNPGAGGGGTHGSGGNGGNATGADFALQGAAGAYGFELAGVTFPTPLGDNGRGGQGGYATSGGPNANAGNGINGRVVVYEYKVS